MYKSTRKVPITEARSLVRKNAVDLDLVWPTGKVKFYPFPSIPKDTFYNARSRSFVVVDKKLQRYRMVEEQPTWLRSRRHVIRKKVKPDPLEHEECHFYTNETIKGK